MTALNLRYAKEADSLSGPVRLATAKSGWFAPTMADEIWAQYYDATHAAGDSPQKKIKSASIEAQINLQNVSGLNC